MQSVARIQLVGPVMLFCALLAADGAAYALAHAPSSALLWYLNLEVFSLFRKSRALLPDYFNLPFAQVFIIAVPVALTALAGAALKRNLCLAISTNLSLVFAAFLAYGWLTWSNASRITAASLTSVHVPAGEALYLPATLLLASVISFAASHFVYLKVLRRKP